jgi:hypothetical protein
MTSIEKLSKEQIEVLQIACIHISSHELLIIFFMKVVACVGLLNSKVFFCHGMFVSTWFKQFLKKIVDPTIHANVIRVVGDVIFQTEYPYIEVFLIT